MAIKAKPKRRAQSNHSRGAFPRRLTWREVESAFNHMFEQGVETTEATRLIHRFKRARSQLLPIFSVMVVSPYERERTLANELLGKIGGRTTLTMVESVLADIEVYDPFKLELRRLAEKLAVETAHLTDDEDDDDGDGERPTRAKADGEADGADDGDGEERGRQPRGRAKRGRAGAARGKRGAPGESEAAEPAAVQRPRPSRHRKLKPMTEAEAKQLFSRPGEAFLAALDDPIDRLVAGFWLIDPAKRVSFADRLMKVDEPRLVPFLTALLASDQRALVHSALKAIATLGHASAMEGVEALISRTQTKAILQRAEEVRARLLEVAAEGPRGDSATAEEPGDGRRRSRRSRPRPKNADVLGEPPVEVESDAELDSDEPRSESAEPADAKGLGLVLRMAPPVELVSETPIEATARLPRLQNCLASGLGSDGTQWIWVYRAGAGGTLERLTLCVDDAGWQAAVLDQGLPSDADRADLAAALEAGQQRVEVTMAYGRRRVQQAASVNAERALPLPSCASAAMAWLGSGRRVEVEDEVDSETLITVEPAQVMALLEHPLMAGWGVRVTPEGEATAQWLATRRRRSASRQRKLLIDDLVNAWLDEVGSATLAERLRLQAWLLRRANQDELADVATALAAHLLGDRATDNMLLREIVYRALGVALDEVRDLRHAERAERRDRPAPEPRPAAPEVIDIEPDDDDDEGDEPDESPARSERESRDGRRRDRRRRGGRNRRRGPGRAVVGKRLVATRCRRRRLAARRVRQTTARRLTVSRALLARKNRSHRRRR